MTEEMHTSSQATTTQVGGYSLRHLLVRVLRNNPDRDLDVVTRELYSEIQREDNPDSFIIAALKEWVKSNNDLDLLVPETVRKNRKVQAQSAKVTLVAKIRHAVTEVIEREAQIKLIDMMMPNGKKLRDCTGAELRALGPRLETWVVRVGRRIRLTDRVGDVLSADEVQDMYARTHTVPPATAR